MEEAVVLRMTDTNDEWTVVYINSSELSVVAEVKAANRTQAVMAALIDGAGFDSDGKGGWFFDQENFLRGLADVEILLVTRGRHASNGGADSVEPEELVIEFERVEAEQPERLRYSEGET